MPFGAPGIYQSSREAEYGRERRPAHLHPVPAAVRPGEALERAAPAHRRHGLRLGPPEPLPPDGQRRQSLCRQGPRAAPPPLPRRRPAARRRDHRRLRARGTGLWAAGDDGPGDRPDGTGVAAGARASRLVPARSGGLLQESRRPRRGRQGLWRRACGGRRCRPARLCQPGRAPQPRRLLVGLSRSPYRAGHRRLPLRRRMEAAGRSLAGAHRHGALLRAARRLRRRCRRRRRCRGPGAASRRLRLPAQSVALVGFPQRLAARPLRGAAPRRAVDLLSGGPRHAARRGRGRRRGSPPPGRACASALPVRRRLLDRRDDAGGLRVRLLAAARRGAHAPRRLGVAALRHLVRHRRRQRHEGVAAGAERGRAAGPGDRAACRRRRPAAPHRGAQLLRADAHQPRPARGPRRRCPACCSQPAAASTSRWST